MTLPRICRDAPRLLSCLALQEWNMSTITRRLFSRACGTQLANFSTAPEAPTDTEAVLHKLVNHEQQGVPSSAGAKGSKAFDLVSPLQRLGRPILSLSQPFSTCCMTGEHAQVGGSPWRATRTLVSTPHCWHKRKRLNSNFAGFHSEAESDMQWPLH